MSDSRVPESLFLGVLFGVAVVVGAKYFVAGNWKLPEWAKGSKRNGAMVKELQGSSGSTQAEAPRASISRKALDAPAPDGHHDDLNRKDRRELQELLDTIHP